MQFRQGKFVFFIKRKCQYILYNDKKKCKKNRRSIGTENTSLIRYDTSSGYI